MKGIILLVIAAGIVLAAVIYRASENAELAKPITAVSTAAGAYQERVWDYKQSREALKLEVDQQTQAARVVAAQLWAILPPALAGLFGLAGVAWCIAAAAGRWQKRNQLHPASNGMLPVVKEQLTPDTWRYVDTNKIVGTSATFSRHELGQREQVDPNLATLVEQASGYARASAALPRETVDRRNLREVLRERIIGGDTDNTPVQVVHIAGDDLRQLRLESGGDQDDNSV